MTQNMEKPSKKMNPKEGASIISKTFFFYTLKLFAQGFRKELEEEDVYDVIKTYKSKTLAQEFETAWNENKLHDQNFWIFRLLWTCHGFYYIFLGIVKILVNILLLLVEPYALGKLVSYFVANQTFMTKKDAYCYAFMIIGAKLLKAVYTSNFELLIATLGIKVRAALSAFIYTKLLKLRLHNLDVSIGKAVTFLSKDVQIFELLIKYANDIWIGFIKAALVCYLVYQKAGVSAFAGVAAFVLYIPIDIYMASKAVAYRAEMCRNSDTRLQLVQEVLSGVRLIKMHCWEKYFKDKLYTARKKEIRSIFKILFWRVAVLVIGNTSVQLGLFFFLLTYRLLGNQITVEVVFFVLQSFRTLSDTLSLLTPAGFLAIAESVASSRRIEALIQKSELSSDKTRYKSAEPVICMKNVNIIVKEKRLLKDICFFIDKGLTVVTGPVGSGKTSLLKCILGEYTSETGYTIIHGDISYASQKPWLFPATIRQNILLWQDYDEGRYLEVLKVCDLVYDLKLLEKGDETVVENGGANLSTGQQIRINLARALYKNSDIYLIDDCLSGLDAHVANLIYQECRKFLKKRVVVVVSHNRKYCQEADNVFVFDNGEMKVVPKSSDTATGRRNFMNSHTLNSQTDSQHVDETTPLLSKKEQKQKVYYEDKKEGKVDLRNYHSYVKHGGGYLFLVITLIGYVFAPFASSFTDELISNWANLESATNITSYEEQQKQKNRLYYLYCFMVVCLTLSFWFKFYSVYFSARKVSINFHKKISSSLVDATMRFFDNHAIANILNRFCRDFIVIDEHIPVAFYSLFAAFVAIVSIIILIVKVNAIFLIPSAVYLVVLFLFRRFYIQTARSLKRLDVSTTSPVYGHMIATIEGLTTIRAFNAQEVLTDKFTSHQDKYTSVSYTYQCIVKAFAFICDILCLVFVAAIILKFLVIDDDKNSPGSVGLAITQAAMLGTVLELGIRHWAELENQMTSVERILEYVAAKQENQTGSVLDNWPQAGEVRYESVSLYYSTPHELVLQNIDFTVKANEKVAIVGRTGAGKSALIDCLFRLYNFDGRITIDGVDIKTLPLDLLRSNISIIPQNATLFTGSIRENIDPEHKYGDDDIWHVLELVHIKKFISSLDLEVKNDDEMFSDGHRQLLCLARVLIRKSRIVVFDEATANLDSDTDAVIYDVLRKNFEASTVLMITHKLQSISMCDKIMVLEKGEIVEWGDREELLEREGGALLGLLQKAGLDINI